MKSKIQIRKNDRVLVVDDDPERQEWFRRSLSQVMMVSKALTPADGVTLLSVLGFDLIFLDHDAGWIYDTEKQEAVVASTFMEVAEWLAQVEYSGTVIIHSYNPVGAKRMAHMLGRHATVHVMPFSTFEIEVNP